MKYKIQTKYIIICNLFIFVCIAICIYYINNRIQLESKYPIQKLNISNNDNILSIGILGDSWAYNSHIYNMDIYISNLLKSNNIESKIVIKGKKGAKSKDIYLSLVKPNYNLDFSSILNSSLDYCIIFIGINDLHGQYGKKFYTYHTSLIIDILLKNNITPILIEIPYFNNESQYEKYSIIKKICYHILSFYTNLNFKLDNLIAYREEMSNRIMNNSYINKIIYIQTDKILKNNQSIYTDDMHINKLGYELLYKFIIYKIIEINKTRIKF